MVTGSVSSVLRGSVKFGKGTDSHMFSKVDVTSDASSSDVVPVGVVWRKLFTGAGFDDIHPRRDFNLARSFQVASVFADERIGGDVSDGRHVDGRRVGSMGVVGGVGRGLRGSGDRKSVV